MNPVELEEYKNKMTSARRAIPFFTPGMKKNQGFTLLIAIVVTSMLLIVSFVVVNVALKQLVLANSSEESQYAFYSADSGTECAVYWDLKNSAASAFATSTAGTISCNSQSISTGSQNNIATNPVSSSLIGGGGSGNPTSIFQLNFTKGCVIVRVTKLANGNTTIDSRGYNTCNTSAVRRFERGITLTYQGNTTAFGGNNSLVSNDGAGGTITDITVGSNTYRVHTFTASGTFVVPTVGVSSVEYLVVGGGGGSSSAGGGAGGFRSGSLSVNSGQSYPITVGNGGAGTTGAGGTAGSNGGDSVFSLITSTGGGGGGGGWTGSACGEAAHSGGSGGGGAATYETGGCFTTAIGGTGTIGQGNNGGNGSPHTGNSTELQTGGGGGAGAMGGTATASSPGNGGAGILSSISGSAVTYSGGGGGSASFTSGGTGGLGGGGSGGRADTGAPGSPGSPNTGGGGGGTVGSALSGGSGIVIIRYLMN